MKAVLKCILLYFWLSIGTEHWKLEVSTFFSQKTKKKRQLKNPKIDSFYIFEFSFCLNFASEKGLLIKASIEDLAAWIYKTVKVSHPPPTVVHSCCSKSHISGFALWRLDFHSAMDPYHYLWEKNLWAHILSTNGDALRAAPPIAKGHRPDPNTMTSQQNKNRKDMKIIYYLFRKFSSLK